MNLRGMKLVLVAVGAAALIASPAFARTQKRAPVAFEAYASASEAYTVRSVIGWDGRVVGADPDLNTRFQLMRDAFANEN